MSDTQERAQELLGSVLVELRQRTSEGSTRYDVVRAAGLMRMLICDRRRPTLLDDALGGSVSSLRFNIRTPLHLRVLGGGSPAILARGLTPYDVDARTVILGLDEFRSVEVAQVAVRDEETASCSVSDVIRYAANVLGGVHYDQPKGRRERATAALLASTRCDVPRVIPDISGVVLNALHAYEPGSPGVVLRSPEV